MVFGTTPEGHVVSGVSKKCVRGQVFHYHISRLRAASYAFTNRLTVV